MHMKRINLVIMTAVITFSTLVFAFFVLFGGADMRAAQKREPVELYAACLTESVMFAVIGEYIFGKQ